MKTLSKMTWLGAGLLAGVVALAPVAVADHPKLAMAEKGAKAAPELTLDVIVSKHLAALGGAELLRATKSFSYVATGEKAGKKYTKSLTYARGGKLRIDFETDEGKGSKGTDGKTAWVRKPGEAVMALTGDDAAGVKDHADFDEPLLDYAKRGIGVKLVGTSEVAGKPAYELEVARANGDIARHFIDASSFLPVQRTWITKKDGKAITTVVRLGDWKKVQGRMINHSSEFTAEGISGKGTISQVAFDKPYADAVFAMPKQ